MTADASGAEGPGGFYDRLGVAPDADLDTVRAAYRRRARQLHPDLHPGLAGPMLGDTHLDMARVNEAWAVLSDATRRADYDRVRALAQRQIDRVGAEASRAGRGRPTSFTRPAPSAQPGGGGGVHGPRLIVTRKEAWLEGMAVRIRFLAGYAGRSAVQAMLLRHPGTARSTWEAIVPLVCARLSLDTGERVRQARLAGAAPLDLANAAALLGLSAYAEELLGPLGLRHPPEERVRHAEMVDRIYATLAYELPRELVHQLGNAPKVARRLARR